MSLIIAAGAALTQTGAGFASPVADMIRPMPIPGHPHTAKGYYPEHSIVCDEQGTVLLDLAVGSDGRVKTSRLLRSSGHVDLDNGASQAVKTWTYLPAIHDGKPIAAHTRVAVLFKNDPPVTAVERIGHYVMSIMCPFVDRLQGRH